MKNTWWIVIVPSIIASAVLIFVIAVFLVKLLWIWTIPYLFPGAVEQGLVVRSISWLTACKLAIFVAILTGLTGMRKK